MIYIVFSFILIEKEMLVRIICYVLWMMILYFMFMMVIIFRILWLNDLNDLLILRFLKIFVYVFKKSLEFIIVKVLRGCRYR